MSVIHMRGKKRNEIPNKADRVCSASRQNAYGDRSLLAKLIKIGAKVVRHSGYITFQMAEVTIDQKLFGEILSRIKRLRYPAV